MRRIERFRALRSADSLLYRAGAHYPPIDESHPKIPLIFRSSRQFLRLRDDIGDAAVRAAGDDKNTVIISEIHKRCVVVVVIR